MVRLVQYIYSMKDFINTLVLGAALATAIVSLYQGVPIVALLKRVVFALLMFYFIGIAIGLMWQAASVSFESYGGKEEESGKKTGAN